MSGRLSFLATSQELKQCLPCLSHLRVSGNAKTAAASVGVAYANWDEARSGTDPDGNTRIPQSLPFDQSPSLECKLCLQRLNQNADPTGLSVTVNRTRDIVVLSDMVMPGPNCSYIPNATLVPGCRHAFHQQCLYVWLALATNEKKRQCPQCDACIDVNLIIRANDWAVQNGVLDDKDDGVEEQTPEQWYQINKRLYPIANSSNNYVEFLGWLHLALQLGSEYSNPPLRAYDFVQAVRNGARAQGNFDLANTMSEQEVYKELYNLASFFEENFPDLFEFP